MGNDRLVRSLIVFYSRMRAPILIVVVSIVMGFAFGEIEGSREPVFQHITARPVKMPSETRTIIPNALSCP